MKSLKSVINTSNIDAVRKTLNVGLLEIKENTLYNKNLVYQKYVDIVNWYNKFIGLEELKKYQKQVTELQEKLFQAQENRRKIGYELSEIRNRSHEVQDQLHKINRQNNINKFLELLKEETEIMKKEQEISNSFNDQDRSERDIFTAFTQAINSAHEKQRAQLEYTKYFGIFISFLGSFLSFVYSSIKKEDLKDAVQKNMQIGFEPIKEKMEKNFEDVETSFVKMQKILRMYEEILNAQNGNVAGGWEQKPRVFGASQDGWEQVLKTSQQGVDRVKETMVQQDTSLKFPDKQDLNENLDQLKSAQKGWKWVLGASQVLKSSQQGVDRVKETMVQQDTSLKFPDKQDLNENLDPLKSAQKGWKWVLGASQVLKSFQQGVNRVKGTMVQEETPSKFPVKDDLDQLKDASQSGYNQATEHQEVSSLSILKNAIVVTLVTVGTLSMMCMVR